MYWVRTLPYHNNLGQTGKNLIESDNIPKLSKNSGLPVLGNKEYSIMKSIKSMRRDKMIPSALLPYLSHRNNKSMSKSELHKYKESLGSKLPSVIKHGRLSEMNKKTLNL